MLAIWGFAIILTFLTLIIFKKMSVLTALVLIPVLYGFIAGFNINDLGKFALDGIKQVAPTGILLMFAVLYFSVMLDTGLFDPVISLIIKKVHGDPLKVILGTSILTMIVHLDGDGTATFMIVLSAFLPIYQKLKISKLVLTTIVALSVGPLHLVPWSGTSVRAISILKSDATHIFNPNIPSILAGIVWVLFVAWYFGHKERKRLGIVNLEYQHQDNLSESQQKLRRPTLLLFNALFTLSLIIILMKGWIPASVLFILASMIVLLINYPSIATQQLVLKGHATNIFMVSSMIFAAGIFSGILTGSKMIESIATTLVSIIPAQYASLLPFITAITSFPASILFTPDAFYFGVVPILSETYVKFGMDSLEIGRAALLGQMTVGFPISPLTASTFLLIGLAEVELGDHQRHTFFWAWGTTLIMTLFALLTGSIHL